MAPQRPPVQQMDSFQLGFEAETQSSRTAQDGCGYLFKYMRVYPSVCVSELWQWQGVKFSKLCFEVVT